MTTQTGSTAQTGSAVGQTGQTAQTGRAGRLGRCRGGRALVAVTALVALAGLSGCSSDSGGKSGPVTPAPAQTQADPALAGLVGAGCPGDAADGMLAKMTEDPLITAAGHNPDLSVFTSALSGDLNKNVNLVDTLNGKPFTVFAPVNEAFVKLPAGTVDSLEPAGASGTLLKLLTYHIVAQQLTPAQLVGTQNTVLGKPLKITRSGGTLKVNNATVLCGGIKTANATLYLIDTVLTPPK